MAALRRAGCDVHVRALVEPATLVEPASATSGVETAKRGDGLLGNSPGFDTTAPLASSGAVGSTSEGAVGSTGEGAVGSTSVRTGKIRRGLRALVWPWQARCDVLITIDPDTALSAWVSSKVLRRRWVADVHEDYRELLRDRAWVPKPLLAVLRGAVSVLNWIITRADLVLVADEHVPPRKAANRFVMRNVPDVTLLPPMPATLVEPASSTSGVETAKRGDGLLESSPGFDTTAPLASSGAVGSTSEGAVGSTSEGAVGSTSEGAVGSTSEKMRAVYIGDNRTTRGLRDMIGAVAATVDDEAPWRLDLVGPVAAADRAWFDARLAQPDARNITWHDRQPPAESWRIAAGADVGLCLLADTPAFRDAMPSKVYEYLAMGMPTIATPLPRVRELVEGTGAGAIVDGVPATVEALRRFATDEAHRAALIANARAAGEELRERPSPYDEAARRVVALSR